MKNAVKLQIICFATAVSFLSCSKSDQLPPIDNAIDLDGNRIVDSSLITPGSFLLSPVLFQPGQDSIEKVKPVFIAVHGFSASNFEWQEFNSFCRSRSGVHVSRVLLGGHGRDYESFRRASWQHWQAPVIEEYNRLRSRGFNNINFIASSTGCPLVLDMIHSGKIESSEIRNIVFIDPIIIPSNKQLSLAPVVGGTVVHYTESGLDPGENGYWYKFRPQEAFRELNTLTKKIRKELEKGISLPPHISLHVYKSENDGSADPMSAVIIDGGISNCNTMMVNSSLHVFTRLKGRPSVSTEDINLQQKTFSEIYNLVK